MKSRLTLHLTLEQSDALDWLVSRKGLPELDHDPREVIGELLLDYARVLRGRDDHVAKLQHLQNELRVQLDAMRRERDGVRKALEAERANRRRDRERHAALRASLGNARKAVVRVRRSRDRYRELAARAEAALLRTPPSGNLALLERRLRLALRKAGFELPPRLSPSAARLAPSRQSNAAG